MDSYSFSGKNGTSRVDEWENGDPSHPAEGAEGATFFGAFCLGQDGRTTHEDHILSVVK